MKETFGGLLVGFVLGLIIGWGCTRDWYRTVAVEHGAAYWIVNNNGSTTFRWKEKEDE